MALPYDKQTWDTTSYVNPTRMNHIEQGIKDLSDNYDKVKQGAIGSDSNQYIVLVSRNANDTTETDTVRKCTGLTYQPNTGHLRLVRPHTSTSAISENFTIGNNIPVGTEGNVYGAMRLFGQGEYYAQFNDVNNLLTNNRTYELPNKNGVLALTSDGIAKYSLNSGTSAHTITFSGTAHLRCSAMILICAGQSFVSNPIIIAFRGSGVGTGTITGVVVSENNVGVTASDLTISIPRLSSDYGTHTLYQLYPEDEITYTAT